MNNYHCHKHYSNIFTPDSPSRIEDYAKKAVERGDKILSSLEHGFQGNYFLTYKIAKEHGLKFIYGSEAYWVKDRFEKDRTNSHMCIFAKTDKGRKALNLALSEANITGYYYKARLDLDLILNLPPDDIFVTSACLAFWKYDDIEDIVVKLHEHFKSNFMLEIQYHNTKKQYDINTQVLEVAKKYNIEMIVGMDSHFIEPEQAEDRDQVLLSKGIVYENEDGWYLDYPTDEEAIKRLKRQNIFEEKDILKAIENTKIFETFDDFDDIDIFSDKIKLPTLYPDLSQSEKDMMLKKIIWEEWKIFRKNIHKSEHKKYLEEIGKEFKIIEDTGMSDYFLIDYKIIKEAVENGGEITESGRGSAVSMFLNTLLGFSKIDRIVAPVTMFPERFMSVSRILEAGSLPDIDFNLGNPEVFAEAQRKIFGEHNSYPMIAYDEFGKKSSWKMYAKAKDVDFNISNTISQSLDDYETALKYASDDEKDMIVLEDYIDEKYIGIFNKSKIYHGIISNAKAHPCGWLIYEKDIREEIGIIRAVSESTKKSTLVCLMDGYTAEKFKYLKNDLLKVDVVKLTNKISRRIDKHIPNERELIKFCNENPRVWDIYKNGWTVGVNQVEKEGTTNKVKRYAPKTIAELCAFIAAIRPSFQSMYKTFEKREHFEYGIPTFDKIIQDTGLDSSFILYQETIMAVLGFAGFPQDETYSILKAISKKRKKDIDKIKLKFVKQFSKIVIEQDGMTEDEAHIAVEKIWKIIEDSSAYGFNASHSYSYAYDSLLCAYYKSEYPIYFYETLMQEYTEKGNKKKVQLLRKEMREAFDIHIQSIKFGNDNRLFTADIESNTINVNMSSVKGIGAKIADNFYDFKDNKFESFTEMLQSIVLNKVANKSQTLVLIKLGYFRDYGTVSNLIDTHTRFFKGDIYKKKTAKKDNLLFDEELISRYCTKETPKQYSGVNYVDILKEIESGEKITEDEILDLVSYQLEYLGAVELTDGDDRRRTVITNIKVTQWNSRLDLYCLATGETKQFKLKKKDYREDIDVGDILYISNFEESHKLTPQKDEDGEIIRNKKGNPEGYDKLDEMEFVLLRYKIEE